MDVDITREDEDHLGMHADTALASGYLIRLLECRKRLIEQKLGANSIEGTPY